jgi:hypothetical protein
VLLIGDSFTEGVGLPFEATYAGLLHAAGRDARKPIEFLNAGAVSYSPIIYLRKVEWLISCGYEFDEVVVFPDLSDVNDEATRYFELDESTPTDCAAVQNAQPRARTERLLVTAATRTTLQYHYRRLTGATRRFQFEENLRPAWTIEGFEVGDAYSPLGIDGGVERAIRNMQRLADVLAAREIGLSVVVYPWPMQLAKNDRNSRHAKIWRDFCEGKCRTFVDTFPAFFRVRDSDPDWYTQLYIDGDCHFSEEGNRVLFEAAKSPLLALAS